MSDQPTKSPDAAITPPGPETQKQRWVKYGANVVLVSVVVVLLGGVAVAIAQQSRLKARVDTTHAGQYSLKPQTKAILRDLKQNVRIVSLYAQTKPLPGKEKDYINLATPVADLLDEYKRSSGGRIEIEIIDPTQNPSKVDDLIAQVTERYGGEIKPYQEFLAGYDKSYESLKKLITDEAGKAASFDQKMLVTSQLGQIVLAAGSGLKNALDDLDTARRSRERLLATKPPNYKGAVDAIQLSVAELSANANEVAKQFEALKDDKAAPPPVKAYAVEAVDRYKAIGKQTAVVVDQIKKLGALKLEDLRQTLRARDGIVVMGPKDMRVISSDHVWQSDPNIRASGGKAVKPQFAGEQQISSAILTLTQDKKPKVAFVRAGGPPLTPEGTMLSSAPGELSRAAAQLREYNFEVLEKDLTGMWAAEALQQSNGIPPEPDPTDEQIKDALWVVIPFPPREGRFGKPPLIGPRVAEHLKAGGSALVLMPPEGEDMSPALSDYGIKVRTDAIAVHEPVGSGGGPQNDAVNDAQKNPFVFIVSQYGSHTLTQPIRSLDALIAAAVPVTTEPKPGVKQWNLIPLPQEPKSWGETNIERLKQNGPITFDPPADMTGPIYAGAVAEKEKGDGRVVVLGNVQFVADNILRVPDREMLEQGYLVSRFPGAMDLFTNSIFWLSKMEAMIAISPSAMDVPRIETMSPGRAWFWRNGVLLIGMPLLVIAAGGLMYVRRRD